jgi:hypothetical protein
MKTVSKVLITLGLTLMIGSLINYGYDKNPDLTFGILLTWFLWITFFEEINRFFRDGGGL